MSIKTKILDEGRIIQEQLIRLLVKFDDRISALEGDECDITKLESDVEALQTTVGDSDSGLVKDVADLESAVGDATSGLVKDVADLESAIGDESTEGTILARIKALEDA